MLGETKGSIFSYEEWILLCTRVRHNVQTSLSRLWNTSELPNRDGTARAGEPVPFFCRHTKPKKKTANNGKEEVAQESYQEARNQSTDLL